MGAPLERVGKVGDEQGARLGGMLCLQGVLNQLCSGRSWKGLFPVLC